MHYLPHGHRAETRVTPDLRPKLKGLALGQTSVGAAPVVIVMAAEPVASLDGTRAARTLALSRGQTVVYLIPVGFAA